jgi:NIPSNAP
VTCVVEIRTYRLKAGTKAEFDRRVRELALPLVRRWGGDVVSCGPSCGPDDGYVLIRAYADTEAVVTEQQAFYDSADWKLGPRELILELIEEHVSVVLEVDDLQLAQLRHLGAPLGIARRSEEGVRDGS